MKVCIVTVYNSRNCGSFFQAYALKKILEQMGHEVVFYHRDAAGTSFSVWHNILDVLKCIAKLRLQSGMLLLRSYLKTVSLVNQFHTINESDMEWNDVDCVILGSDTVWNIDSKYFNLQTQTFFGGRFPDKAVFSYAASIGNTPYEMFSERDDIKEALRKMVCISVRDKYTHDLISTLTDKSISLVCDPTFLLCANEFADTITFEKRNPYILVYYFGAIPGEIKEELLSVRTNSGLEIIVFCDYRTYSWADRCIPYCPDMMLNYFSSAEFIVTNTFHGTIFSVLFEKNFADYGFNKKKVVDLLRELNLDDRFVRDGASLYDLYNRPIDYKVASPIIENMKTQGRIYLKNALDACH